MSKISIIIPVFNQWKLTNACLLSIKEHTLADFEVIVVDNCSTDNSVFIVENYMKNRGGGLKI